jgi:hypothetical protein
MRFPALANIMNNAEIFMRGFYEKNSRRALRARRGYVADGYLFLNLFMIS